MEEKNWYYASYEATGIKDFCPDGDYFCASNDEEAIEIAKTMADAGQDFSDIGHVCLDLESVTRVDPENEWEEIETIWY